MSIKKFLFQFCGVLIAASVLALALDAYYSLLVPQFWLIFGFLAGLTIVAYIASYAGIKTGGELSVYVLMAAIFIKLIVSLLFVVIYLQKHRVNGTFFALEFFSLYFLFTAFEVKSLLLNLRPPK
ncbi:hypothetical protein [Arcticibacter pallidicorallinus]|uniref:hypothetical protein n=1 Tax=Arcticibacter pallidicorallinus TaxID=1259464 RepID=UPI000D0852A1|nr:hypothetical protein [Arcticibacter pallidicorallinus]